MDPAILLTAPHHLSVDCGAGSIPVAGSGVQVDVTAGAVRVRDRSGTLCAVRLRWRMDLPADLRVLGDAWERGYGDLEWRVAVPERPLPWYALIRHGSGLDGIGVATGCASFASWQIDPQGITLTLDVRNGGQSVRLGQRELLAAQIVVRAGLGRQHEDDLSAATAFCRLMCPSPRRLDHPVYGLNDWYAAYSENTADTVLRDGDLLRRLTPNLANRPYHVIDAGWSGQGTCPGGPWTANRKFPDMAGLATSMRAQGSRPGLWIRPLLMQRTVATGMIHPLDAAGTAADVGLDPSLPEVREQTTQLLRTVTGWGYELVKFDFSTWDITRQWGFSMSARPIVGEWRFRDDSRTSAEIIRDWYASIRAGAGTAALLACNTIGHLSAGLCEISRTGDDTSGKHWERTRRMGINTLAMRMPQHNAFHQVDADCVGITPNVDWQMNRQWLDVLARSGTPLFISPDPSAMGDEQCAAVTAAYAVAATPRPVSTPIDWLDTTQPQHWRHADGTATYRWIDDGGPTIACPG